MPRRHNHYPHKNKKTQPVDGVSSSRRTTYSKVLVATALGFCLGSSLQQSRVRLMDRHLFLMDMDDTSENQAVATMSSNNHHQESNSNKLDTDTRMTSSHHYHPWIMTPQHCDKLPAENKFEQIYGQAKWGAKMQTLHNFYGQAQWPPSARKSASGAGSNLGYATETSLQVLRDTITSYNITSMIDIPCGDANWIFDSWETDSLTYYIGLDIVPPVVALNQERFRHHSNKRFQIWDGVQCPLPQIFANDQVKPPELVHARDVLQHLPLQAGMQFLCHIVESNAKYLVTTTFPSNQNRNIVEGRYYRNDLQSAPFNLPNASLCKETHPKIEHDLTCVFDLTQDWVEPWIADKCQAGGITTDAKQQ